MPREDHYKKRERKSQSILNHTVQFIGLILPDGTLIQANRAALTFAGVSETDVLGKPFWETPWWTHSPEMQDQLKAAIQEASQGKLVRFEATHVPPTELCTTSTSPSNRCSTKTARCNS